MTGAEPFGLDEILENAVAALNGPLETEADLIALIGYAAECHEAAAYLRKRESRDEGLFHAVGQDLLAKAVDEYVTARAVHVALIERECGATLN